MGKIGIIVQREFNERVRKKSFIVTTILAPVLLIGIMAATLFVSMNSQTVKHILVTDASGMVGERLQNTATIIFHPVELTTEQIKARETGGVDARGEQIGEQIGEKIYGVLEIGPSIMTDHGDARLYTYEPSTVDVEEALSRQIADAVEAEKLKEYDIENLPAIMEQVKTDVALSSFMINEGGEQTESSSSLALVMAMVFGFVIYFFVFTYGGMVLQGVIEEKSSKVLEVLVGSVKPFQLMMGKILGIAAVALTQFFLWIVIVIVGGALVMQFISPELVSGAASAMAEGSMVGGSMGMGDAGAMGGMGNMAGLENLDPQMLSALGMLSDPMFLIKMIGGFMIYFIGGYLIYAAIFAAIGSAVSNVADTQQLQVPVTMPLILAFVVLMAIVREPNTPLAFWFSIIPLTSPIIMVARLPYGVPGWELLLSLGLLVLTFIFIVWFAGKIYRVGIFMYGKKPTITELLKWTRYKY